MTDILKVHTGCRVDYPQRRCETHLKAISDEVSVRQPDPFGQTSGPAGVWEYSNVVGVGSLKSRKNARVDIFTGHLLEVNGSCW
jgi:hypothetical protein